MPAHLRWLPEARTMIVSHHGTVTPDDLFATDKEALALCEREGQDIRYAADFRRCTLDMSKEDVLAHATRMNALDFWSRIPGLRVAMITDDPRDTAFGMLFNRIATDAGMQIFSTPMGAWEFLGLDDALLTENADLIPPAGPTT